MKENLGRLHNVGSRFIKVNVGSGGHSIVIQSFHVSEILHTIFFFFCLSQGVHTTF